MYVKVKETNLKKKNLTQSNVKFQNGVHFMCLNEDGGKRAKQILLTTLSEH